MLESWKETDYFKEYFTIPKSGEFKEYIKDVIDRAIHELGY